MSRRLGAHILGALCSAALQLAFSTSALANVVCTSSLGSPENAGSEEAEAINAANNSLQGNSKEELENRLNRLQQFPEASHLNQCTQARLLARLVRPGEIDNSCLISCSPSVRGEIQVAKNRAAIPINPIVTNHTTPAVVEKTPGEVETVHDDGGLDGPEVVDPPVEKKRFALFAGLDYAPIAPGGAAGRAALSMLIGERFYFDAGGFFASRSGGPFLGLFYGAGGKDVQLGPELGLSALFPYGERHENLTTDPTTAVGLHFGGKFLYPASEPIAFSLAAGGAVFAVKPDEYASAMFLLNAGLRWSFL